MKVLENNNGYLTQAKEAKVSNMVVSNKVYLAVNDSEDNWKTITKEEGDKIREGQEVLQGIGNVNDLDKVISGSEVVPMIINEVPMTDNEALARKKYYPLWNEFIGKTLFKGFKVQYKDGLYKARQEHTVSEIYPPSIDTAALYEEINEIHEGTLEDPIPYNNNMRLELNKYYSQDGITYKCIRDSEVAVFNNLSELVGIYVEVA